MHGLFKNTNTFLTNYWINTKNKLKISGTTIFYVSHNIQFNRGKYFPYTKNNSQLFKDEKDLSEDTEVVEYIFFGDPES